MLARRGAKLLLMSSSEYLLLESERSFTNCLELFDPILDIGICSYCF